MVKSVSGGMSSHLQEVVTSICSCWKITRTDGTRLGFTDHDRDLTIEGIVYKAATGFYRSAIANSADTSVSNMDVQGFLDDASITESDLRNGLFDYAVVEIFATNWANVSNGIVRLRYGFFGEVMISSSGFFKVELRGLTQLFAQTIGVNYAPECRADLGDDECKVPLSAPVRQSNQQYAVGARMLVPIDPGSSLHLPVRNPGFEIHQNLTTNWVPPNTGFRVINSLDGFGATPAYYLQTASETGVTTYTETAAAVGPTGIPSFDVDLDCKALGHEYRVRLFWANSAGASAGGTYDVNSGWLTPTLGVNTPVHLDLPVGPGGASGAFVYYRVEWRNAGTSAPAGTVANLHFTPRPNVNGQFRPAATLEPSGSPTILSVDWTIPGAGSVITGPNVWMSPQSGDWHLSQACAPGGPLQSFQTIDLTTVPGIDLAKVDAGSYMLDVSCYWGAETTGVKNSIGVTFGPISASYEEPQVIIKGFKFWEPHSYKVAVPSGSRTLIIRLNTYNYTNNARARGVFDSITAHIYEPAYENQTSWLAFNGVEMQCVTAGTTAGAVPTYSYALGDITSDGTAAFQAVVPLHMVTAEITEIVDAHRSFKIAGIDKPTGWFDWGVLEALTGPNLRKKIEVASWDNTTKLITVALPMPFPLVVGDKFRMHTGCAKSREVCSTKFNNMVNYRGEPDLPGTDQYFKIGGANTGGTPPASSGGK